MATNAQKDAVFPTLKALRALDAAAREYYYETKFADREKIPLIFPGQKEIMLEYKEKCLPHYDGGKRYTTHKQRKHKSRKSRKGRKSQKRRRS